MVKIPKFKHSPFTWRDRHFWWCWIWQYFHKREPSDYDGVCMNCRKDRYTGEKT